MNLQLVLGVNGAPIQVINSLTSISDLGKSVRMADADQKRNTRIDVKHRALELSVTRADQLAPDPSFSTTYNVKGPDCRIAVYSYKNKHRPQQRLCTFLMQTHHIHITHTTDYMHTDTMHATDILHTLVSHPGQSILCLSLFIWSGQGVAWVFVCGVFVWGL